MGGLYYNLALRSSDVVNKDSEKLHYCVLKNRGVVDQKTLVNYLSQVSGVQDVLCLTVLSKLGAVVANFLKDGQSVKIPHLGSFNLTVSDSRVKTPGEAKASQIESTSLRFSSREEIDLALSCYMLTQSVLMTNTNDVTKEKDPSSEVVDDPTT